MWAPTKLTKLSLPTPLQQLNYGLARWRLRSCRPLEPEFWKLPGVSDTKNALSLLTSPSIKPFSPWTMDIQGTRIPKLPFRWKKRISPSSRRWSKRRKENFLKQKRASSTPDLDLSSSELESSFFIGTSTFTRLDIPSCEISQRGRSRTERQRKAAGERASKRGPGEDLLDLKACKDVGHLGPDRKKISKYWPIFSIEFWFFDTQNTFYLIVRGLKSAFFMSVTSPVYCYSMILWQSSSKQ